MKNLTLPHPIKTSTTQKCVNQEITESSGQYVGGITGGFVSYAACS